MFFIVAWVVVVEGLLGAVLFCLVGFRLRVFLWVISLVVLVAGDSGFGVSRCCIVEVCGVMFPWCCLR